MSERVLLDCRSERPQFLPFGNTMHLAVALLPQIPEPLVMHLLVLSSSDKARGGLRLLDRSVAADLGTPRLRLRSRPQRLRCSLGVIKTATVADDGIGIGFGQQ